MLIPVVLFCLGLVLLIKGGDWFVDSATNIAHRFHLPEMLIGATVVSIGTTLPEVMVSATSALSGHGEIAYGNAIGSIICNAALIAAITVAVRPGTVDRNSFRVPILFFFAAAVFYCFNAYVFGGFSRISGIVLLLIFSVYLWLQIRSGLAEQREIEKIEDHEEKNRAEIERKQRQIRKLGRRGKRAQIAIDQMMEMSGSIVKDILKLIAGAVLIAVGADLMVDNGTLIAQALGVPEAVIALTIVALGTSLPELVTAITSLIKGHSDLSLGNIVGANLFNLVLVSGVSITLSPFSIPANKTIAGINSSLIIDIPVMMGVMVLLTVPALIRGKLSKVQGYILLASYVVFCIVQFIL